MISQPQREDLGGSGSGSLCWKGPKTNLKFCGNQKICKSYTEYYSWT